jgi:MYXO-CTERM domain-containing protein
MRSSFALVLVLAMTSRAAADSCKAPRMMVVLDKSSSMVTGTVGGQTKWEVAKSALSSVVTTYQSSIDFGLIVFPNPDQCGPGAVKVGVGPGKAQQIMAALASAPPQSGNWTPMAQTLDAAAKLTQLQDSAFSNNVLLITDGWQWCSPYDAKTRFLPVNSTANLKALGITTYVVGFGDSVDPLTLNKMAAAAGTKISASCDVNGNDSKASNNCYYQANDPQQLLAALQKIAKIVSGEKCDGLDNDCNGKIDDGLAGPSCPKQQGVCAGAGAACGGASGWSPCGSSEYAAAATAQGATYQEVETLCDGKDNDCDGAVDEGCACTDGQTRPCGSSTGACKQGTQACQGGSWGACVGEVTPAAESCDGQDNDCNGSIDDGLSRACQTACGGGTEACVAGAWLGCTAQQPAAEICDGLDNDCDGTVDGDKAKCDDGKVCVSGSCQEPAAPAAPPAAGGSSGCDCRLGGGSTPALPLAMLALVAALVVIVRRRR